MLRTALPVIANGLGEMMSPARVRAMQDEVRALARQRDAVILAHNYQVPEIQDVADFVGDSLGLAIEATRTSSPVIVMCGVYFMAETAKIVNPERTVLIPDETAGCSLADSITVEQLIAWKAEHPGATVVSYVNTTAAIKAESDYCVTSGNAEAVIRAIPEDQQILFLPDVFLGTWLKESLGRENMEIWMGECHVHAGIRPADIARVRAEHPGADFLIHPECGCSTSVMEYVAAGEVDPHSTHMLSTGGMLRHAGASSADTFIVATETGMLHPLREQNPGKRFVPANRAAVCQYMKMITLPKVRDALRSGGNGYEVRVEPPIAERARRPIERMVAIGA